MAKSLSGIGYGDIFLVNTPALDRWGQQMYVEQKQREAKQQQENAAFDAQLQKEIGKVRSVDAPLIIQKYQQVKEGRKRLLFDKQLQKDQIAFNQLKQATDLGIQDIYRTANGSAEVKEQFKMMNQDHFKNPNGYDDNYGAMAVAGMNTPLDQLQNHPQFGDLSNWDNYRYKGSNTNWAEHVQKGSGQVRRISGKPVSVQGGLATSTPIYEAGNAPQQVKDYLIGVMGLHQTGRDAAWNWDHLPEKEIEETIKAYQALPKEYWEQMGLSGPQDIRSKNPDSKAENWASYLAMKNAISHGPRQVDTKIEQDRNAIMKAQEAMQKRMDDYRTANDLKLAREKPNPNDVELNNAWLEGTWSNRIAEAKSGKPSGVTDADSGMGIKVKWKIKPDPVMAKALSREGREPYEIYVTDKNEIYPVFYQYKDVYENGKKVGTEVVKDGAGNPIPDSDYSQPMELEQAMMATGHKTLSKGKSFSQAMNALIDSKVKGNAAQPSESKTREKYPLPAGKPRTVKQGGYTYTWNSQTGQYE